jgi:hypothetical protein
MCLHHHFFIRKPTWVSLTCARAPLLLLVLLVPNMVGIIPCRPVCTIQTNINHKEGAHMCARLAALTWQLVNMHVNPWHMKHEANYTSCPHQLTHKSSKAQDHEQEHDVAFMSHLQHALHTRR